MIYSFFFHFGRYWLMMKQAISRPEKYRMYWREMAQQMNDIGVGSLSIVGLISVFIGAVTAVQFSYQLGGTFIPRYYIGYIVRDLTIIELAPTITCLVLAGKVGSNMASEIGGMRQKEHIDAMEIMGVNTAAYLIMPRTLAAIIVIPMLVSLAAFISIAGAWIASIPTGLFTHSEFVRGLRIFFEPYNVTMMFVKSFVFAFILTTVACYQGYYVRGGSVELGKASTRAVVYGDTLILLSDYLIAVLMTG